MVTSPWKAAAAVACLAALPIPAAAGAQDPGPRPALFKDARQMLAIARAQGRPHVNLLIASAPGQNDRVARQAAALGGEVRFRDDDVSYLRVRVPVDRATELAGFDRIEAVTVDFTGEDPFRQAPGADRPENVRPEGAPAPAGRLSVRDTVEWPPRWSDRPLREPYRAIRDIDGEAFRSENPTFDGRGVTIALLDGSFDFLLPEFQTAYALDGTPVPKVADYLNVTDPREDADVMPQWVDMRERVRARAGRVEFRGKRFTTPAEGAYRIGLFDERRFNDPANAAYLGQDIDRNGNPRGDDGLFGVLWDEESNQVWVDTDRDLSFADETPLTDYIERGDFGVFGTDDPETDVRESIGFTVQTDPVNEFVSINVGIYQHATEIMGHVVGNPDPDGRLEGVAPGARLLSVFYGGSNAHGLIEGLIRAFQHPLTDLVVLEQSVAIASVPYLLSDGRHPISVVAQRLTDRYQKLLFVPGGNAPGVGIVAEDGGAPGAVSVGGYQHRDSYLANNGFEPAQADNMHWGGLSHGPSGIGALKPDLLAPSGQMSVDIGYVYRKFEQELRGLYQLPAGYFVDGGTSTATPMAAGAAALVISAAKQTGVPYDAARLKAALLGSARHIPNLAAHEQGSGLVQVAAAYDLLRAMQDETPIVVRSRGPVRTRLSGLLPTPHTGVGIYEREGWSVGERGTRRLTLTRTTGPEGPMTFSLRWQGNDGTFDSPASVTLPLNRPVDVPVEVAVSSPGAHSAVLLVEHTDLTAPVHKVLATVIAPLRPTRENGYKVVTEIEVPIPGDRGVFVEVPPGAAALRFSATADDSSLVRLTTISPHRETVYPCAWQAQPGQPCSVADPEPGVWEINATFRDLVREYDPGRPRPVPPGRVTLTATVLGGEIAGARNAPAALAAGESGAVAVTVSNRFGAVPTGLATRPLASARRLDARIAAGEQHVYEIQVPEGARSLSARVAPRSDHTADLDLYLIDCTAADADPAPAAPERDRGNKAPPAPPPGCSPRAKAATVDASGRVEVATPAAGRWVVVVDAYRVPAGTARYSYVDLFTHPRLGGVSSADVEAAREAGASWTPAAHVWAAAEPDGGRSLMAALRVTSQAVKTAAGDLIPLATLELPLATDAGGAATGDGGGGS